MKQLSSRKRISYHLLFRREAEIHYFFSPYQISNSPSLPYFLPTELVLISFGNLSPPLPPPPPPHLLLLLSLLLPSISDKLFSSGPEGKRRKVIFKSNTCHLQSSGGGKKADSREIYLRLRLSRIMQSERRREKNTQRVFEKGATFLCQPRFFGSF